MHCPKHYVQAFYRHSPARTIREQGARAAAVSPKFLKDCTLILQARGFRRVVLQNSGLMGDGFRNGEDRRRASGSRVTHAHACPHRPTTQLSHFTITSTPLPTVTRIDKVSLSWSGIQVNAPLRALAATLQSHILSLQFVRCLKLLLILRKRDSTLVAPFMRLRHSLYTWTTPCPCKSQHNIECGSPIQDNLSFSIHSQYQNTLLCCQSISTDVFLADGLWKGGLQSCAMCTCLETCSTRIAVSQLSVCFSLPSA